MFYTSGWRPIADLYRVVAFDLLHPGEDLDEGGGTALSSQERMTRVHSVVEELAKELTQLGVLLGNGQCVNASTELLAGPWEDLKSFHVSLRLGNIGTGYILDEVQKLKAAEQELKLALTYGPFRGCPVLISEAEAVEALRAKFPHFTGELQLPASHITETISASEMEQPRRPRGHPKHGDGLIERMVLHHFGPRVVRGGELYLTNRTVLYEQASAWVEERTCGLVKVAPNTIRDYLAPLLKYTPPLDPASDGK